MKAEYALLDARFAEESLIIHKLIYADAGLKYIDAGRQLSTRREIGIKVRQQSWNKLATRVAIFPD